MQTPETDQAPSCEQCGAPILNDSADLGCVHCLLRAGIESPEAATFRRQTWGRETINITKCWCTPTAHLGSWAAGPWE